MQKSKLNYQSRLSVHCPLSTNHGPLILRLALLHRISAVSGVLYNVGDRFTVDLHCAGGIKSYRYLVALDDLDILGVANVGTLEYLRKDWNDTRAGKIVRNDEGHLSVGGKPILIGRNLHSAAEITSVCCRSKPNALIFLGHTVDCDGCAARGKLAKQSAQSNGSIINRLFLILALAVSRFANVAVKTKADVIYKDNILSVDADKGQIFYVLPDIKRLCTAILAKVIEKIVAASRAVIIDLLLDLKTAGIVDKMMKRSVAAREDHDAIIIAGNEKIIKAAKRGNINKTHLSVSQHRFKLTRRSFCLAVIRQRIVKYNVILQGGIPPKKSI